MDISRRHFLQAAGGLVAVSALPAFADDPSVFPLRGKYERLVLSYQRIDAGATKPFSVLHISDTHLTEAYPDENEMKHFISCIEPGETYSHRCVYHFKIR